MERKAGDVASLQYVVPLADCVGDAAERTGGKAAGLGRLLQEGLPVPGGFAVTTDAYSEALAAHAETLADKGASGARSRELIEAIELPDSIAEAVVSAYRQLGDDVPVAVRSSATAEDTGEASFAGQQETYLWIRGENAVLEAIRRCWASLFTDRAISYRDRISFDDDLAMAVVVQEMVDAEAAGVALTLDPATGARDVVYLEVALGLGEGVVRGDVPVDRLWVGDETRTEAAEKDRAHRFDPDAGEVRLCDVDPPVSELALSDGEIAEVAGLARKVEAAFGTPMDIEWAVGPDREIALLQARPETVWSRKEAPAPPGEADDWDPLHHTTPGGVHWTTVNLGETAPGVLSPLAWTLWGSAGETAIRRAGHNLGVLEDSELAPRGDDDRYVKAFYGRAAMQVEFLATLGDRMPGTSGADAVRSILGDAPDTIAFAPTRHRWPAIARRLPEVFVRTPGRLHAVAEETEAWWQDAVDRVGGLDRRGAAALFAEAEERFAQTLALQTTGLLGVVQPLYDGLERLCQKTGVGDATALSSGYSGFQEVVVIAELWRAARNQTTVADIVRKHGFHGPLEGEVSSRVWREEPQILEKLLGEYANREDPRARDEKLRAERIRLEGELIAAVPLPVRPAVRGFLKLCEQRIPLRGVAKRSFLQSIDVARASARRFGELLAADGVIESGEDVFYLTADEIKGALPEDAGELVKLRRARRDEYRSLTIPPSWRGRCVPVDPAAAHDGDEDVLTGIGVSSGVAEGIVRVLESSSSDDLQPDEVLVAPTTDPSWSSIMFISSALVVDIGGALSHASMVARELGIPCVVNTGDGTRRLKTGDRVRVDGGKGAVEVIERAEQD